MGTGVMTHVWGDALDSDAFEDWAEFVPFNPSPLVMSGISIYELLAGTAVVLPATTATANVYPAVSGRPNVSEFVP